VRPMNPFWFLLLICFYVSQCFSQAESSEPSNDKAVRQTQKDGAFKLSSEAIKTIDVKLEVVKQLPRLINQSTLVHYGDKVGVFRLREGFFKLVEVKASKSPGYRFVISSEELSPTDEIAVSGVALLRVSQMEAFGGEG